MVEMLEALRRRADKSIRTIESWGKRNRCPLARSTISDVLTKKRAPRKEFVSGFVRACGVDDAAVDPWLAAWERLQRTGAAPEDEPLANPTPLSFEESGVLWVGHSYLIEHDWNDAFTNSVNLDILVAYGQTWRNIFVRQLTSFAACPGKRIRVYLPNAEDPDTIRPLAWRFDMEIGHLREKIEEARDFYAGIRVPGGAQVEVYFRSGEFLFNAYVFDACSVVTFYSHTRTRTSAPPALVSGPGSVSNFLSEQLKVIHQESRRVIPVQ